MAKKKGEHDADSGASIDDPAANNGGGNPGPPAPPANPGEEVTALVQAHAAAVEDRFDALDKRVDQVDQRAGDDFRALRTRVAELADQLHDFGVRLGLLPKGTPTPAAAEAAKEPPPDLIHDGTGWVPGPPKPHKKHKHERDE